MLILIFWILSIYWVGQRWGDGAGAVVLAAGIVLLCVLGTKTENDRWRAHVNWTEHWKKSGPERYAERRQWAEDGKRLYESRRPVWTVRNERSVEPHVILGPTGKNMDLYAVRKKDLFVCPRCGKMVRAESRQVIVGGHVMKEYMCPRCRMRNRTGI